MAREAPEGNVREIVGKMKLEEMVSDRQKFANLVKENAEPDLAAMGLDIISFNVQNFVDGNEVIENLGIDNIVKIKKSAAIARAESERDIKVAQAAADKESNDAAVAAQTEIAKKQNELAIKKSELQMEADTKKYCCSRRSALPCGVESSGYRILEMFPASTCGLTASRYSDLLKVSRSNSS